MLMDLYEMAYCSFQLNDNGLWECTQCLYIYPIKSEEPPMGNCLQSPDLRPVAERLGIAWEDAEHYAQALARWTAAGFPVRTREEVEACFRVCKGGCGNGSCNEPCEHYRKGKKPDEGRCRVCRCGVSRSRMAVLNKIKMKTESCPKGKW